VYCAGRADFSKGRPAADAPTASHMDIWRRMAAVKIMHGTPGVPKPKHGGK
jgi:hypothetical protein